MKHEGIIITEIRSGAEKYLHTKQVLDSLPEWFGNKEAIESYAMGVSGLPFWAALYGDGLCIGFLSVKIHYGHTGDIYVCGIRPEYHRKGIGGSSMPRPKDTLSKTAANMPLSRHSAIQTAMRPTSEPGHFIKASVLNLLSR